MRRALCSLLFAAALFGQTAEDKVAIGNLTSTLIGIGTADASRDRLTQRFADDILALADRDREPSRTAVIGFAEELTAALYGKKLSNRSVIALQHSIYDVLRRSGATFDSAASLRQVLDRTGVETTKAQLITRRFMAIGEEIKGPDDIPQQKFK